ncbi:MAG: VOC family protein [Gemmatimonadaceae bacterium]
MKAAIMERRYGGPGALKVEEVPTPTPKANEGATVLHRVDAPDGSAVAQLSVDGAEFWVSDESPSNLNFSPESLGGCSVRMLLMVQDPDAVCQRAVAAGATQVVPVQDGHGWRLGRILDPFGHHWEVARPPS